MDIWKDVQKWWWVCSERMSITTFTVTNIFYCHIIATIHVNVITTGSNHHNNTCISIFTYVLSKPPHSLLSMSQSCYLSLCPSSHSLSLSQPVKQEGLPHRSGVCTRVSALWTQCLVAFLLQSACSWGNVGYSGNAQPTKYVFVCHPHLPKNCQLTFL